MSIVAWIIFGGTTAFCAWTLWSTIAPQRRLIADLLMNGPLPFAAASYTAPARSVVRDVRVRRVSAPASRRAAA